MLEIIEYGSDTDDMVVLLHGAASHSGQWRELIRLTCTKSHVVAFNQYGYGRSPSWSGPSRMLFSDQAEPIISFLKTSRKPFHLVGHSHGGSVAAIVASALPENLLSLSIYEPNAFDLIKQVDEQEEFTQLEILFEGMLSRSSSMEDSTQFTEKLLNFWLGEGAWITLSDRLKGQLIQLIDPTIGDVYAALYSPMDLTGFEVIQERTLLMFDPYTPRPALAVTHAFHHLFPHVTVRNFPKRGHLAPIFYAEEVNREIIKHIEKWAR